MTRLEMTYEGISLFDNNNGAEFSMNRKYRYKLWRVWDTNSSLAMCIGLNPSTANGDKNDPTILNLSTMLSRLNYGGFYMMNCFPLISSKPQALEIYYNTPEYLHQQKLNMEKIIDTATNCKDIIFAWGNFRQVSNGFVDVELLKRFPEAKCFGHNANGTPSHPLAMMYKGIINTVQLRKYNQK